MQKSGKKSSPQQIKEKIYAFCAYQERSHREVKKKLFDYGLYGQEVDEMVTALIIDGYLNEERFAKAFAGGKFRIKYWGRIKIEHELEAHGLTKKCIHSGMLEINESDYIETLRKLLLKKSLLLRAEDNFTKRNKLARFAVSKGYESELVWKIVDDIVGRQ